MDADEIAGVELVANPVKPTHQSWKGIGMANRNFSSFYADQTIDGDQVIQLDGEPAPDWFAPLATGISKTASCRCFSASFNLRTAPSHLSG
ncbi:hypothetical protein G6M02_19725 [Agrobacterium rhizogenes]|nr:hypothetical protein [Rhizobium rhizogenes]